MPPRDLTPLADLLLRQLRAGGGEPDIADTLQQVKRFCEEQLAEYWATFPRLHGSGVVETKEVPRA